jgi:toxin ParE1/3/4
VSHRLTAAARADIKDILRRTGQRFGPAQRGRYSRLIATAATIVGNDPLRPGSRERSEFGHGLRSFHIGLAAGRSGAAAHVLYYRVQQRDGRSAGILIIRVLHERMDPMRHIDPDF